MHQIVSIAQDIISHVHRILNMYVLHNNYLTTLAHGHDILSCKRPMIAMLSSYTTCSIL